MEAKDKANVAYQSLRQDIVKKAEDSANPQTKSILGNINSQINQVAGQAQQLRTSKRRSLSELNNTIARSKRQAYVSAVARGLNNGVQSLRARKAFAETVNNTLIGQESQLESQSNVLSSQTNQLFSQKLDVLHNNIRSEISKSIKGNLTNLVGGDIAFGSGPGLFERLGGLVGIKDVGRYVNDNSLKNYLEGGALEGVRTSFDIRGQGGTTPTSQDGLLGTAAGTAGLTTAGAVAGGAIGSTVGSVIPGLGTVVGGAIGTVGGAIGGAASSFFADRYSNYAAGDNSAVLKSIADNYGITEEELMNAIKDQ